MRRSCNIPRFKLFKSTLAKVNCWGDWTVGLSIFFISSVSLDCSWLLWVLCRNSEICFSVCVGRRGMCVCFVRPIVPVVCNHTQTHTYSRAHTHTHCVPGTAELSLGQSGQGVCVCMRVHASTYQCASCYVWQAGTMFGLPFSSMKHWWLGFQLISVPSTSYITFASLPVFSAFIVLSLALIFTQQPCSVCLCTAWKAPSFICLQYQKQTSGSIQNTY